MKGAFAPDGLIEQQGIIIMSGEFLAQLKSCLRFFLGDSALNNRIEFFLVISKILYILEIAGNRVIYAEQGSFCGFQFLALGHHRITVGTKNLIAVVSG